MSQPPANHWSHYWQQGNLTSLPQGFAGNYDGEFLAFWEAQFAALPAGASVLDVCSGNGAIALLACDYSRRHARDLRVSVSDAAAIETARVLQAHPQLQPHVESMTFLPGTPLETLALAAGSIDLVTSQFGVEYTQWETAAATIWRMLRPGGRFAMVCHSPESTILPAMEAQHAEYARMTTIGLLAPGNGDTHRPADFDTQLEQTLAALYQLFQQNRSSQLLSAAGSRLEAIRQRAQREPDAAWRDFVALRAGIAASQGIAADLLAVNRALSAHPDWYQAFINAGLALVETTTIHYHTGEKAGDAYRFMKADTSPQQASQQQ